MILITHVSRGPGLYCTVTSTQFDWSLGSSLLTERFLIGLVCNFVGWKYFWSIPKICIKERYLTKLWFIRVTNNILKAFNSMGTKTRFIFNIFICHWKYQHHKLQINWTTHCKQIFLHSLIIQNWQKYNGELVKAEDDISRSLQRLGYWSPWRHFWIKYNLFDEWPGACWLSWRWNLTGSASPRQHEQW